MSRRFTIVTVALAAVVAFLVGAIIAGGLNQSATVVGKSDTRAASRIAPASSAARTAPVVDFADVVERVNPAVVNVDATSRAPEADRRRGSGLPDSFDPFNNGPGFGYLPGGSPQRGAGSGFIID